MAKNDVKNTSSTFGQLKMVYRLIKESVPFIWLYLLLAFCGTFGLLLIPIIITGKYFWLILAFAVSLTVTLLVFNRFADRIGYQRLADQPGRTGAILSSINKRNYFFEEEPVAVDYKTMDMVFRGIGKAGIFIVSEGPSNRVKKMIGVEARKVSRVAPNTPIITIHAGDGADQVPLKKLKKEVTKNKPVLKKAEVLALRKRMSSLGGFKPPIPKGMDLRNMKRPSKKALFRGK